MSVNNVLVSLGNYSYSMFFSLIRNMMGDNEAEVAKIVDDIYNAFELDKLGDFKTVIHWNV